MKLSTKSDYSNVLFNQLNIINSMISLEAPGVEKENERNPLSLSLFR